MQTLSDRTAGAWRPSPGAVYPALSQLEDEGLIEAFDNDGQKAFRLTEVGKQEASQVKRLAERGYKIDAIKELRSIYSPKLGLKEAKELVESMVIC